MRLKEVPFTWIQRWGMRLDTAPYMGGAVEARFILESLKAKTQRLCEVTAGGMSGIVHAGRIKRQWVEDPRYGTPFLSSTDILRADLTHCSLISNKAVHSNPLLIIHEGWTLITRAGTVGRMAYSRPDMDGMACTEDVLRVVPDKAIIPSGYLFAFLNSKYGIPMVTSGTYGAIIQHIEPEHISGLLVPRFDEAIEAEAHSFVEGAASNRTKAAVFRRQSREQLLSSLSLPDMSQEGTPTTFATFQLPAKSLGRLDAAYHSPPGVMAAEALKRFAPRETLGAVCRVFQTNIFKRPYVSDPAYGYPYFSGAELFTYDPQPRGYLRKKAPGIDEYLVRRDWLLMQDAGQLGGLIGQVMRVTADQDGSVVSNHLIRIVAQERTDAAYLFALLASPVGFRSVVRNAFGTSIPQLESTHLAQIMIPWPEKRIREQIAEPVVLSWDLEDEASRLDRNAVALVERAIEKDS